ncbi:TldE protein, part of TldE/TldD proteolytic complex [hydrothermal vent metagenome]|uniref:TldE protein, part of TldE/TldD proteolytic complex n=1 Tax=hydrothermal vent metagenome TaxID=652676 RepID=A0A1W1C6E4_9ZZZZ
MDNNLENTLDLVFDLLKKQKITAFEFSLGMDKRISTAVRLGNVESLQNHINQEFNITVYNGKKKGNASSGDLATESILNTINSASLIAQYTSEDKFLGFAPKKEMAWDIPNLDLYHPWDLSAQDSIELALACEGSALNNPKITNSEGAEISSVAGSSYYANSLDLVLNHKYSNHSLHCGVIAKGNNEMQNAYDYSIALDKNDLVDGTLIGKNAAETAIKKLNSQKLNSQKCPIIIAAELSSGLFANFFSAISGAKQYNKTTFLYQAINNKIFPDWLSIQENPFEKKTIGSLAFDTDGVKTRKQYFIKDGSLERYMLSQYSANQLGLKTTANAGGVHNVSITNQQLTQDDLIKKMDKGILVTELMGQGVDITTGNYSRGALGFWVENGQIQYPVSGFTIAGNLKEMFLNIIAISDDIDSRKNIKVGSVLIDNMSIAGE